MIHPVVLSFPGKTLELSKIGRDAEKDEGKESDIKEKW
jgi:hypothetical protein